jgi:hypothetical protein
MNERIRDLETQCWEPQGVGPAQFNPEKFAQLIVQAIYDDVKEELIEDELINIEPDRMSREYLKGCNGGIVDALTHIKNFGKDIEE